MSNTGSGKIVHLSDEAHARVKALAKQWGVSMRECAERLIAEGIAGNIRRLPINIEPVAQRKQPKPPASKNTEQIIQGPPFWAGREKKES